VTTGHVVHVGLSGSGKTTIGRLLAARLERPFVDTDDLIVRHAGRPIPEVFATDGEATFRAIERECVAEALAAAPSIIATGGGAPVDPTNRRALWDGNTVVWLDAPVEALVTRVGEAGAGRPLLSGGAATRLETLRREREHVYAAAHLHLDTGALSTADAVNAILSTLLAGPATSR
jgi:shikimate kinase